MAGIERPLIRGSRLMDRSTYKLARSEARAFTDEDAVRETFAVRRDGAAFLIADRAVEPRPTMSGRDLRPIPECQRPITLELRREK
jgi:hypothetical protein